METWACVMPQVQFLCVCVESARVAQMFDDIEIIEDPEPLEDIPF